MKRESRRVWRLMVPLVVIGAAAWALLRRPEKAAPPVQMPPAVSVVVSASEVVVPPAATAPPSEPTIDPESIAEFPPPDAPNTCSAGLSLEFKVMREDGAGRGCARPADGGSIPEGLWVIQYPGNRVAAGNFFRGDKDGLWTAWHSTGRRASVLMWDKGVQNGVEIEWTPTGVRFAERTYKNGVLDGSLTLTQADGTIIHQVWQGGRRISPPADNFPSP